MKKIYFTALFILISVAYFPREANAYSWLYVFDPHSFTGSGQGSIDEALITIEPKGIYAEYTLYLTFSAKGLELGPNDSLEISYYFSLPSQAIVHDSWLWVDDSIVKARLMDRWSAWTIYEGIVKRRRDPSVLYKDWQNNYQLRIYPLMGNATRKVKISFLAPSDWSARFVTCPLPLDMLASSLIPTNPVRLLVKVNDQWRQPSISGYSDIRFVPAGSDFPGFMETILPPACVQNQMNLSYTSPLQNGIYLSRYPSDSNGGYYQLAFLPAEVFNIRKQSKVLAMFDFEAENSYQTNGNQVYSAFRTILSNSLTSRDKFNILFSAEDIPVWAADAWINADSASLQHTFSRIGGKPVSDFTNLKKYLEAAIHFIRNNGNDGEIMLFTNSDNFFETNEANGFINELEKTGKLPRITVIDFYELWYNWKNINGYYYRGNQYLYTLLSRQSGGNYFQYNYWEGPVTGIVDKAFAGMCGYLESFDLYTRLANGFCYGRYNLGTGGQSINLGKPILQIGKYTGTGELFVEAAAVYNDSARYAAQSFSGESEADTLLRKAWAGCYIEAMEQNWNWDNEHIQDIIQMSLDNRVLSMYTAFLALEPGMPYQPENPDNPQATSSAGTETVIANVASTDKTNFTAIGSNSIDVMSIPYKLFPNPFHNRMHLQVSLPSVIDYKSVLVEIYNNTGQKIRAFSMGELIYNGFLNLEWDGRNGAGDEVSPGIYYIVLRNDQFRKDIKVVKIM